MVSLSIIGAISLTGIWIQNPAAPLRPIKFSDYAVKEIYRGPTATLRHNFDRVAPKTNVKQAIKGKVNFGGHYILAIGSCGTGCNSLSAFDAQTGVVYWFRHSLITDPKQRAPAIEFHADSTLLILRGARDEQAADNGTHYYYFSGDDFLELRTELPHVPTERRGLGSDPASRTLASQVGIHRFEVKVAKRQFQASKHKIVKGPDGQIRIDGLLPNGVKSPQLPTQELTQFEVKIDGQIWPIISRLWKDCYEPHLGSVPGTNRSRIKGKLTPNGNEFTFTMECGSGPNAYVAIWTMNRSGRVTRDIRK